MAYENLSSVAKVRTDIPRCYHNKRQKERNKCTENVTDDDIQHVSIKTEKTVIDLADGKDMDDPCILVPR